MNKRVMQQSLLKGRCIAACFYQMAAKSSILAVWAAAGI